MKTSTFKFKLTAYLLLLAALAVGCTKEAAYYKFLAQSESPAEEDGSKVHLVNESFVYWDIYDTIDAWRIGGDNKVTLIFQGNTSNPTAMFEPLDNTVKFGGSGNRYIALFPHNDGNSYTSGDPTIVFPSVQTYATDDGDYTFGKSACPMVAYGGEQYDREGEEEIVRMVFHNLCGIVRIQIRNTGDVKTLKRIRFTSTDGKKLSGSFTVSDIDKYNPYVTATSSGYDTVTISNINQTLSTGLLTFYLVLPSISNTAAYTEYNLAMHVVARANNGDDYYLNKNFTVPIRRNGITKMPAIAINNWAHEENASGGAIVEIAGNGTTDRPFLIYSVEDLQKVRDAFNNKANLNGINVTQTPCTYRIMTSQIQLNSNNWNKGIMDFCGNMVYWANQTSAPGIENNTRIPIFESIAANGTVQNLVVKGTYNWTESDASFSPLCNSNAGRITNCRVSDNASYTLSNGGLAGICVTNSGTISGCGCRASLNAPTVAGICLENSGTIVACYTSSPTHTTNSNCAAGICYHNTGKIKDCYFASNINALNATEWGGIVYLNSDGPNSLVSHCYIDASGIIQSRTSIGGIVHTMEGGVIDNCWNDADLMNVQGGTATGGGLGSIVYNMQGGEVRNCIRYRPTGSLTCTGKGVVGGFVARMSGGTVLNCAFYGDMTQSTVQTKGAFVGVISGGTIENVYAYQKTPLGPPTQFYGQKSGSPTLNACYGQTEQNGVSIPVNNTVLCGSLNGWNAPESDIYMQWELETGSNPEPPTLNPSGYISHQATTQRRK